MFTVWFIGWVAFIAMALFVNWRTGGQTGRQELGAAALFGLIWFIFLGSLILLGIFDFFLSDD